MKTYDFSMKSVMCYFEYNERYLKYIYILRVSQVGGEGGGLLHGTAAQIWVFLYEPSLR